MISFFLYKLSRYFLDNGASFVPTRFNEFVPKLLFACCDNKQQQQQQQQFGTFSDNELCHYKLALKLTEGIPALVSDPLDKRQLQTRSKWTDLMQSSRHTEQTDLWAP